MSQKSTKPVKKTSDAPTASSPPQQRPEPPATKQPAPDAAKDHGFSMVLGRGVAAKLNPKAEGNIYFQLARQNQDGVLYLRITGNDGGGLHTKEWINLETVIETLRALPDGPFGSKVLKPCVLGKSSNNVSFLAAILRSPELALIQPEGDKAFLHALGTDFEEKAEKVLKRTSG